eukprot:TRINITY_DN3307_c0_g2_i5.p1 TRINITY_DN3307_c0_g2~~TRINITY_DN3307_c0_g2_i5.p1  ORF type:complete len:222 (+),score=18.12 TRINITY_DN3307_c0_g2_i5:54-719(+)
MYNFGVHQLCLLFLHTWWRTDPYFLSPWKSFIKLMIDMKETTQWVDIIKAVDIEMTHQKVRQTSGRILTPQIKQFMGSFRRPFSRNYQHQNTVKLQNFEGQNYTSQNANQIESANDLYATYSQQSDDFINGFQRSRPQQVQQDEVSSTTFGEHDEDIEMQNNIQYISFPLQSVEHARIFLFQVLHNKKYKYALKNYMDFGKFGTYQISNQYLRVSLVNHNN